MKTQISKQHIAAVAVQAPTLLDPSLARGMLWRAFLMLCLYRRRGGAGDRPNAVCEQQHRIYGKPSRRDLHQRVLPRWDTGKHLAHRDSHLRGRGVGGIWNEPVCPSKPYLQLLVYRHD
jgi:hypothetical protein